MKLRNKKTEKIVKFVGITICDGKLFLELEDEIGYFKREYKSLDKLNSEWEDYEDDEYWHINWASVNSVLKAKHPLPLQEAFDKEIGNYFETEEEAEKAVEKLKCWKRLKDKGFKFDKVSGCWIEFILKTPTSDEDYKQSQKDLHLLFGGEE